MHLSQAVEVVWFLYNAGYLLFPYCFFPRSHHSDSAIYHICPSIDPQIQNTHSTAIQHPKHNSTNTTTEIMAPNSVIKIDLSEVTSASFIITIPNGEEDVEGQVQFFHRNRYSHAVETRQEDDKIYVKVTPRDEIIREQVVAPVEAERDDSTTASIKREEREIAADAVIKDADANDILLTVGEDGLARNMRPEELGLALSPVKAEPVEEEAADRSFSVPAVYMYAAEAPLANIDSDETAADTLPHRHDTRYQRRLRQQREQLSHRDTIFPSRFHSRPHVHVHDRAAIPPRQRKRLQRLARAVLEILHD